MTEATRTAPERIYASRGPTFPRGGVWTADEWEHDTEYVRADLYEEAITALQKLDRELTREFGEPSPPLDGVDEAQIAARDLLRRHEERAAPTTEDAR